MMLSFGYITPTASSHDSAHSMPQWETALQKLMAQGLQKGVLWAGAVSNQSVTCHGLNTKSYLRKTTPSLQQRLSQAPASQIFQIEVSETCRAASSRWPREASPERERERTPLNPRPQTPNPKPLLTVFVILEQLLRYTLALCVHDVRIFISTVRIHVHTFYMHTPHAHAALCMYIYICTYILIVHMYRCVYIYIYKHV